MGELDALQRWMLAVVTHEGGLSAGLRAAELPLGAKSLVDVVPGNDRLSSEEQLQIYAYAYFERIREALASEVPTVAHLLGDEAFSKAMRAFLQAHPSSSYTLDRVGEPLADWFEAQSDPLFKAAADMVRVERGMDAVFDAREVPPAAIDALSSLPLEDWADARITWIPGLAVMTLQHDVTPAMNAAKNDLPAECPAVEATWMAVYCRSFRRFRLPIEREAFLLITALAQGQTLGEALEGVALTPGVDLANLMSQVGGWFERWMAAGWIAQVRVG